MTSEFLAYIVWMCTSYLPHKYLRAGGTVGLWAYAPSPLLDPILEQPEMKHFPSKVFLTTETQQAVLSIYALSFYRSQNVLCRSKFSVSVQKFIYILCQSQTFCARPKDDLHSVKLFFVLAQKFLKRH